jgi:hypothetical protein
MAAYSRTYPCVLATMPVAAALSAAHLSANLFPDVLPGIGIVARPPLTGGSAAAGRVLSGAHPILRFPVGRASIREVIRSASAGVAGSAKRSVPTKRRGLVARRASFDKLRSALLPALQGDSIRSKSAPAQRVGAILSARRREKDSATCPIGGLSWFTSGRYSGRGHLMIAPNYSRTSCCHRRSASLQTRALAAVHNRCQKSGLSA